VGCLDLPSDALDSVVAEIAAGGGNAWQIPCDITSEQGVCEALNHLVADDEGLDAVINVAGILRFSEFEKTSLEDFQAVMNVNLTGAFLVSRTLMPALLLRRGNIVNVASNAAIMGLPFAAAYCASKGALTALTRQMAVEYADRGIRVNSVCPGDIGNTDMYRQVSLPQSPAVKLLKRSQALTGSGSADAVAAVIAMVASSEAEHMSGSQVMVDGGSSA
jgi:NAD(P)-dependent dehydrogenase (short-subunit alcohol dehydrogenase family)